MSVDAFDCMNNDFIEDESMIVLNSDSSILTSSGIFGGLSMLQRLFQLVRVYSKLERLGGSFFCV